MKKSAGADCISNWLVKECNQNIAVKLRKLINVLLSKGKVPMEWKHANIVQIYKGRSKVVLNYRLVSLTKIIAKMKTTTTG